MRDHDTTGGDDVYRDAARAANDFPIDYTRHLPKPAQGKGRNGPVIRYNAAGEIIPAPAAQNHPADAARQKGSPAERELLNALLAQRVSQRRTGFPDFAILDGPNGVPVGFVEVKRGPNDRRRFDQAAFQRFCEHYAIPYALWWPGQPLPDWVSALAGADANSRVLLDGERVAVPKRYRNPLSYRRRNAQMK